VGPASLDQDPVAGLDPEAVAGVEGEFAVTDAVLADRRVAGEIGQAVAEH
jgi:hypothetical protein